MEQRMSEAESTTLTCYIHPDRETRLRCSRCEKPICTSCANQTPTGYRCKNCIRSQQKVFETAVTLDYILAILIAAALSFGGSFLASIMGFFTLFIAPIIGVIIAEAVRRATQRRRSTLLYKITTISASVGSLPLLLIQLGSLFLMLSLSEGFSLFMFLPLVWQGLYTSIIASTVFYRLSGIQLRSRF
jgi:hypothetical protein